MIHGDLLGMREGQERHRQNGSSLLDLFLYSEWQDAEKASANAHGEESTPVLQIMTWDVEGQVQGKRGTERLRARKTQTNKKTSLC